MISIFTLILEANESREVAISGEYFELRNALFPVTLIELLDRSGGVVSRMENPEQSDFVRPGHYETVRITNGETAQTIKHFYGSGDAGSRRTSGQVQVQGTVNVAGDVAVIDNEKSRVILGEVFAASPAISAANYAQVQIWNPIGSIKNLIIGSIKISLNAAGVLVASAGIAPLTLDVTALRSSNLKMGSALGIANARTQDAVAAYNYANGSIYFVAAQAGIMYDCIGKSPIIVPPGFGLNINSLTLGATLTANMIFREENI